MSATIEVTMKRASGDVVDDVVAVEEPMEIRIGAKPISVMMRTPGDDFELAAGFLFTEGIVTSREQIASMRHWGSPNVVRVALRDGSVVDWQKLQRHFYATSSCGVCGKTSIDAIRVHAKPVASAARFPSALITTMPDLARPAQKAFTATGAIHGAALFTVAGELLHVREDIGRHNAVDKVIGAAFLEEASFSALALFVSGRAGFEIVQKAAVASIPLVAAVGAPSSLAVELAREFNLTLAGFVRDGRFNVYAGVERIL
jgi:FdhD protein